jgi:curved DNA-binding protein CbpA
MASETSIQFIDYYQVLQVWPTASLEAIKKAYFKLAKIYHPDVATRAGEAPKEGNVDFALINEAFSVLSDDVKRRQFDEQLKARGASRSEMREADKRSAQLAYEQARTAMKHNRYDKAVMLLRSATKFDENNPTYHSWYGFALAALNTNLHEARDACKKALEVEFYNAEFHANLGYVYHQAGLASTAEESFLEALKWDPDNALALKHLYGSTKKKMGLVGSIKSMFGISNNQPASQPNSNLKRNRKSPSKKVR